MFIHRTLRDVFAIVGLLPPTPTPPHPTPPAKKPMKLTQCYSCMMSTLSPVSSVLMSFSTSANKRSSSSFLWICRDTRGK